MMLDVLFKIKDEQDPALSFRRSCRCARVALFALFAAASHHASSAAPPCLYCPLTPSPVCCA
jgi:hypothetical protein